MTVSETCASDWCLTNPCLVTRNGGVDESGGHKVLRADSGGAEPAVRGVQERDRSAARVVAYHSEHRAQGGGEGRVQVGAHQELPQPSGEGAERHLSGLSTHLLFSLLKLGLRSGHPVSAGQEPDPCCTEWRVKGLLLQDVSSCPSLVRV